MSRLCKLCGQVEDQEHFLLNLRNHQESSNSILQPMKDTDRTPFKYFRTYFNVTYFFKTCLTELAVAKDIKPFLLHWTSMPHTQESGYETSLSSTAALILSHHIVDRPWMGWHTPV